MIDNHQSLAYYEGALEAAFRECWELERALHLDTIGGIHIALWYRLKQWEQLLRELREREDGGKSS